MKLQMEELLLVRKRPFDPLVLGVHKLCVVRQALVVTDISVERIPVVSCVGRRAETPCYQWKNKAVKGCCLTQVSNLQRFKAIYNTVWQYDALKKGIEGILKCNAFVIGCAQQTE